MATLVIEPTSAYQRQRPKDIITEPPLSVASDARAVPKGALPFDKSSTPGTSNHSYRREERDRRDQDHHHNAENEGNDADARLGIGA